MVSLCGRRIGEGSAGAPRGGRDRLVKLALCGVELPLKVHHYAMKPAFCILTAGADPDLHLHFPDDRLKVLGHGEPCPKHVAPLPKVPHNPGHLTLVLNIRLDRKDRDARGL